MHAEVGVQEAASRTPCRRALAHEDLRQDLAHAELGGEVVDSGERGRRDAPGSEIVHDGITLRVYRRAETDAAEARSGSGSAA